MSRDRGRRNEEPSVSSSETRDEQVAPVFRFPRRCTPAAASYFATWREVNSFLWWLTSLVVHMDRSIEVAHDALVTTGDLEERQREEERSGNERKRGGKAGFQSSRD